MHRGEVQVKTEEEIELMNLYIKEGKGLPAANRHYNRGMGQILPESRQKESTLLTL